MSENLIVRHLGLCDYQPSWNLMQAFTAARNEKTEDELWLLQHPPVYTQGVSGKAEHVLNAQDIPVIQSNRGGQVTYHGPGQIVGYVMLDLRRREMGIRQLVTMLEETIIELLLTWQIKAVARTDAPGVYVNANKVASLGLRVSRGCSYHGLALNVDMDLTPFKGINPCGFKGLGVTSMRRLGVAASLETVAEQLAVIFTARMGYNLILSPAIPV